MEEAEVASLCRRVTADIDDALRLGGEDDVDDVVVHTGSWGVGDDNIRLTVLCDKAFGQDVLHVPGKEKGILDAVQGRIDFGILDSLRHIFDAHHLAGLAGDEVGDSPGSGVEVINQLVASQTGEVACYFI